jgi:aromatic-L-amino-acid/L-tryptophan decarboxylase
MNTPNLDPRDWEDFRKTSHKALDLILDQLRELSSQPAWRPIPTEMIKTISEEPLPLTGIGEARTLDRFQEQVLPYPNGSWHPRFWGWVQGTGIPWAMIADMLASGMNAHLAGFNQAPKWVEHKVVSWIAEMLGWPSTSQGLLSSGATMSNILALCVARNEISNRNVRSEGLQNPDGVLTVYCSDQTHGWIDKGIELLGIGTDNLRKIATDSEGRIRVDSLRTAIDKDLRQGNIPVCVCGNAGAVHFGATDDLNQLADICKEYGLWFHVDGAFGAFAYLVPEMRADLHGMERADSLAVDLHKWMYLPFDIGCLLCQKTDVLERTFAHSQTYMKKTDRGLLAGGVPFADMGVELSRPFRALKAWMCIQAYGVNAFSDCIRSNIEHARLLARLVSSHDRFELMAPVPLNIVCFRYRPTIYEESNLFEESIIDAFNNELLLRLQESGQAVLSSTMIHGKFCLRAAFTNHRTQNSDVELFFPTIVKLAESLEKQPGN